MSKRRKSQKKIKPQRDTTAITKRKLLRHYIFHKDRQTTPDKIGFDGRRYIPPTDDHPRRTDGRRVSYKMSYPRRTKQTDPTLGRIAFADPRRVTVCQRRKKRRISLFKAGKIGKGIKVTPYRRMTKNSHIKC